MWSRLVAPSRWKQSLGENKEANCVTAGSGIGRAIALAFAAGGVRHLICADINIENAEETANQARQIGHTQGLKEATAILVDVRKEADVQGLFEAAKAQSSINACLVRHADCCLPSLVRVFQNPSATCQ